MTRLVSSVGMIGRRSRWQKQRGPRDSQDTRNGLLGRGVPAQCICPRDADIVDLDAAGLGETKADVVPVVREDDCGLVCRSQSEDVFVCTFVDLVPLTVIDCQLSQRHTPSRTVRSDTTPPVLKCLNPLKMT